VLNDSEVLRMTDFTKFARAREFFKEDESRGSHLPSTDEISLTPIIQDQSLLQN